MERGLRGGGAAAEGSPLPRPRGAAGRKILRDAGPEGWG